MAEHKIPTIADRQNEYQQRMRKLMISPARADPFADGKSNPVVWKLSEPFDKFSSGSGWMLSYLF